MDNKGLGLSENIQICLSRLLLHLATESDGTLRGKLVQQRAMRLLLDLVQSTHEKSKNDAALALARIAISTNPALYPVGVAEDMALPLIRFMKDTSHELYQFETLLALTNLTSSNEDIRRTLWKEKAWYDLRMILTSENWKVQVAGLETQTNMVMCEEAIEHFISEAGDQDIQIFLAFCRSGDFQAVRAASGALAMISHVEEIAKKIINQKGVETIQPLLENEHEEISQRAQVILENIEPFETATISE